MAEIEIAESGDALTARRFIAFMQQSEAKLVREKTAFSVATLDGFRTYQLPDGRTVELWRDQVSEVSLRGEPALIRSIAQAFAKAISNG